LIKEKMREEKSKSGKVKMRNKALFIGIIGIVAIALAVAAIGANANIISHAEASDEVNVPDVPHKINYQGYLTDADGNQITGDLDMTFKIYDSPTGGAPLWSETQTSVRVGKGLFTVILGSVNPIPGDVFPSGGSRWLETEIEDQTLTPRKEIVSVAYALKADKDNDWDYTNNQPHMYSIPPGNVGIGTESPQAKLDVITTDATTGLKVKISGSGPKSGWAAYFENAATGELPGCGVKAVGHPGVYGETDVSGYTGVAGVYGVTHDATNYGVHGENTADGFAGYFDGKGYFSDNVGIGTTNPQGLLQVGEGTFIVTLQNWVGIGTTDPGEKLHVYDGATTAWIVVESNTDEAGITLKQRGAVPGKWGIMTVPVDGSLRISQEPEGEHRLTINRYGMVGIGTTNPGEKLHVIGSIYKTGIVSFVQPHPTDSTKEIVYVSLEGPEAGTYIRGTAQLVDGEAIINLPEHFSLVTSDEGLTVQLTPIGEWLQLYLVEKSTQQILIREANGKNGQFDYIVQGVRKGYEDHQVIRDKE
jgi:hypothetical protein